MMKGGSYTKIKAFVTNIVIMILLFSVRADAQQPPPRPISVTWNPAFGLRFGAFFTSTSGGTVVVSPAGTRSATGSIVLAALGFTYGAASFDVLATPGTRITIVNGPDVTLSGSAGGSVTLHIGSSSPSSPYVTTAVPPATNTVTIGGTLTVGGAVSSPAGSYSGSFYVTFFQE